MKTYRLVTNKGSFYVRAFEKDLREAERQYIQNALKTMPLSAIVFTYTPLDLQKLWSLVEP